MIARKMTFWFLVIVFAVGISIDSFAARQRRVEGPMEIQMRKEKSAVARSMRITEYAARKNGEPAYVKIKEAERIFGAALKNVKSEGAKTVLKGALELRKAGIVLNACLKTGEVWWIIYPKYGNVFTSREEDTLIEEAACQIAYKDFMDTCRKFLNTVSKIDEPAKVEAAVAFFKAKGQNDIAEMYLKQFNLAGFGCSWKDEILNPYLFLDYAMVDSKGAPAISIPATGKTVTKLRGGAKMISGGYHYLPGCANATPEELSIAKEKASVALEELLAGRKEKIENYEYWRQKSVEVEKPPLLLKISKLSSIEKTALIDDIRYFLLRLSYQGELEGRKRSELIREWAKEFHPNKQLCGLPKEREQWEKISEAKYLQLKNPQEKWINQYPESDLIAKQKLCDEFVGALKQHREEAIKSRAIKELNEKEKKELGKLMRTASKIEHGIRDLKLSSSQEAGKDIEKLEKELSRTMERINETIDKGRERLGRTP